MSILCNCRRGFCKGNFDSSCRIIQLVTSYDEDWVLPWSTPNKEVWRDQEADVNIPSLKSLSSNG